MRARRGNFDNVKSILGSGEETSEYNYCDYYQLEIEPQRKEIKEALGALSWMPIYEGTERSFFIEKLQPNMRFHVRVKTINSAGESHGCLPRRKRRRRSGGTPFEVAQIVSE